MEREPRDWISAWRFRAKSFIIKGPCQFTFMWFIRCHIVVHFNLTVRSLQLRGLQSWRYRRTGKGKQIHELRRYPYLTGLLQVHWSCLCRNLQTPVAEAFWAVGAPGCTRTGSGPAEPEEGDSVSQGARPGQQLPWAARLAAAERGFPATCHGNTAMAQHRQDCAWGSVLQLQL